LASVNVHHATNRGTTSWEEEEEEEEEEEWPQEGRPTKLRYSARRSTTKLNVSPDVRSLLEVLLGRDEYFCV
jgi:hypothetical protein